MKATQLVETVRAIVLFSFRSLELENGKAPGLPRGPTSWNAHFFEIAKLGVAFFKKPQAVQKVGTAPCLDSFS